MDNLTSANGDTTQRGEQARRQLIIAALDLFGERGLDGASTRQIANKAGQNIGAIAYYFQSKEGLYLAVAEWITQVILQASKDVKCEIDDALASGVLDAEPNQCLNLIKKIVRVYLTLLTKPETLNFSKIILREQLAPTSAFKLIHERSLAPFHTRLTELIACYIGIDKSSVRAIVHAHAIIGEILSFRVGRESMLLRAGWANIAVAEVEIIEDILFQHIELILSGLKVKYAVAKAELNADRQSD